MFKLAGLPSQFKRYFRSLTCEFHWVHTQYFYELVLLMATAVHSAPAK